jgi:hypothetical protein
MIVFQPAINFIFPHTSSDLLRKLPTGLLFPTGKLSPRFPGKGKARIFLILVFTDELDKGAGIKK